MKPTARSDATSPSESMHSLPDLHVESADSRNGDLPEQKTALASGSDSVALGDRVLACLSLAGQPPRLIASGLVLVLAVAWSYQSLLKWLVVETWWSQPDYLYGFLVLPFALVLLWARRDLVDGVGTPSVAWALVCFAIAAAMKWAGGYYLIRHLDGLSLVPSLCGIALLLGGWKALRWAWPSIVFLLFMLPLPGFAAIAFSRVLQRIGTIASTYFIQTIGIPAVSQGNVISLENTQIGVVDACSGLRMIMLFAAVCTGAAFLSRRGPVFRIALIVSAIPIAIVANIARITVTAVLYRFASAELANIVFHDLAGFFMMPLAVVLLWMETEFLSRLLLESPQGPVMLGTPAKAATRHGTRGGNAASGHSRKRREALRRDERRVR